MVCPSCGNENPDSSVVCSVCNSPLVSTPGASYSAPSYTATPAKKGGAGAIIGIVAVIVVLAIVACVGFFGLGWKYNGTYELDSISSNGMTFTMEQAEELMGSSFSAELKVSFGKYELVGDVLGTSGTEKGKIKFKGDKFTIDDDYEGYVEDGNLVIEESGTAMIFKKK